MFRGLNSYASRKLHKVKIDELDLEHIGLTLDKDYTFTIPPLNEEVEEISIPGRDSTYTKHIRWLDRTFSITFNIGNVKQYQSFLIKLMKILEESKGKLIKINEETIGLKLKRFSIDSQNRGIESNDITINFICYPFMYDNEGNEYKI